MIKDSLNLPSNSNLLFTLRPDLDNETLLVNAYQDLESINAIAANLAFEVDDPQRSVQRRPSGTHRGQARLPHF
ncbi:hypothetical protein EJ576_18385 [Pseudomonas sp. C 49-2]|uniref:DUF6124 family protein n=1 Tax=Pseudomonas TaxID=286 RepID=UPI000F821546|nr:hypothetical protein [Pseudomonas sp. C 49-2]RTX97356.1 hypothetical protein EJ576_18385 [Pseudomonas sp. C 49-2]